MGQLPSVVTRWLSGPQNFTLDTLSDIEEMLGVHLLVTEVTYSADHPRTGQRIESEKPQQADVSRAAERFIEHHYVPVFYKAETVPAGCEWTETPRSIQYTKIVCAK